MIVYVILNISNGHTSLESVWDNFDEADSAVTEYHKMKGPKAQYLIIKRELNKLHK